MSNTQNPTTAPLAPNPRKAAVTPLDPLAAAAAGGKPVTELSDDLAGASEDVRTLNADLEGDAPLSVDDEVALVSDQMSGEYIGVLPAGAAGLFGAVPAAAAAGLGPLAALAGLAALAAGNDDDPAAPPAATPKDPLDPPEDPEGPTAGHNGLAGAVLDLETAAANAGLPNGDGALSGGIETLGTMVGDGGSATPLSPLSTGFQDIAGSVTTDDGTGGLIGGLASGSGGASTALTDNLSPLPEAIAGADASQLDAILGEGNGALLQDAVLDIYGVAGPAPASSSAGLGDLPIAPPSGLL